jgi:hypothetical protein
LRIANDYEAMAKLAEGPAARTIGAERCIRLVWCTLSRFFDTTASRVMLGEQDQAC